MVTNNTSCTCTYMPLYVCICMYDDQKHRWMYYELHCSPFCFRTSSNLECFSFWPSLAMKSSRVRFFLVQYAKLTLFINVSYHFFLRVAFRTCVYSGWLFYDDNYWPFSRDVAWEHDECMMTFWFVSISVHVTVILSLDNAWKLSKPTDWNGTAYQY